MVFFEDEMKPGMMHDHMEGHTCKFWYTYDSINKYRKQLKITLFIEDGTEDKEIKKVLERRFGKVDITYIKRW